MPPKLNEAFQKIAEGFADQSELCQELKKREAWQFCQSPQFNKKQNHENNI